MGYKVMIYMNVTNQIYDELEELFGYEIYDQETEDCMYDYLNTKYKGPEWFIFTRMVTNSYSIGLGCWFQNEKEQVFYTLKYDLR